MRWKLTLGLVLGNLLVFFLIYQTEYRSAKPTQGGEIAGIFGSAGLDVERIEIAGKALSPPRILERRKGTWYLVSPIEWPANYYAVNRILNQMQFLEKEVSFTVSEVERSGQTLEAYGLAAPTLTLSFTSGKETAALKMGAPTRIGNRLYALSPDNKEIFVISKYLVQGLSVDIHDLRSQAIFGIPLYEIRSFALQLDELKIRLKRDDKQWLFEAPIQTKADPEQVNTTLNRIITTSLHSFVEQQDNALQGLSNPSMRITLQGNNRRETLLLGKRIEAEGEPDLLYARLEDRATVFTVLAAPFDRLRNVQEILREKDFVQFEQPLINSIEIRGADQTITLQKLETGTWQMLAKNREGQLETQAASESVVQSIMQGLLNLRAVRFASDAPSESAIKRFGFGDPQRTVVLKSHRQQLILSIGNRNDETGLLYAKLGPPDLPTYVYEIQPYVLDVIPQNPLHYRIRVLERHPTATRVQRLKLTALPQGHRLLDETILPETGDWDTHLQQKENKAAILALIKAMLHFEVEAYLEDAFTDAVELKSGERTPWAYRLDVTFYLPGGEKVRQKERTFFFTQRLGDNRQLGGSPDYDRVFMLTQPMMDTLSELTAQTPTLQQTLEKEPQQQPGQ